MGSARNIGADRALLGSLLQRLGLPLALSSPLIAHADAVAADTRLGLVAPGEAIIPRHTCDSLLFALARRPEPGERWADVGSGAGFPGLVLACCYPGTSFTLIEPNGRKAGFLELQVSNLGLGNAAVEARRAEDGDDSFDVAIARALAEPAAAMVSLRSLVRPRGSILVAAGRAERTPAGAERVALEGVGDVDSPGVLFMMSLQA